MFTNDVDYNAIAQATMYETEPLLTIEIPESNLDQMKDFEDQVFNNMNRHGSDHYQLFNTLMTQKQKEKFYKDKHPAVKKAYEHYSLLLKLAQSGELDA
jgi:hypothetical protein